MEKLLLEGIEVQFSDFSKELQEKIYLKNKKNFQKDAANSQYEDVRRLLIEDNQTTDEILKQVLDKELKGQGCIFNIVCILNHPNFKQNEVILGKLAQSKKWKERQLAARLSNSSELLNEMFRKELDGDDEDVKKVILDNPSFKADEVTIGKLAQSKYRENRLLAARLSNSLKRLNEMLRKELDGDNEEDVKKAILYNPSFKTDEVTLGKFVQSNNWNWETRQRVAQLSNSSEFLNEMLRNELNGYNNRNVEKAIWNNSSFKADEVTLDRFAQSKKWKERQLAAELSESFEFLNEMLQKELDGDNNAVVEFAILHNPKFRFKK